MSYFFKYIIYYHSYYTVIPVRVSGGIVTLEYH